MAPSSEIYIPDETLWAAAAGAAGTRLVVRALRAGPEPWQVRIGRVAAGE
ncbi:hypothetical protein AB0M87_25625 [Streptomyces sp. NPDC051320]